MDTAAIPLPPSCPLLQLGTAAAAEKPPQKCDGIYVAEPRCDAEISMQIFCPLFPVLMTFGHQKKIRETRQCQSQPLRQNKYDLMGSKWKFPHFSHPGHYLLTIVFLPSFPFTHATKSLRNLQQVFHDLVTTSGAEPSGLGIRSRNYYCESWDSFLPAQEERSVGRAEKLHQICSVSHLSPVSKLKKSLAFQLEY